MTEQELKALVDSELRGAMGEVGDLAHERALAMDRYLAEPIGTEMEGRSQVQTRDVMDVIEWIMPTLIRIFTESDRAVKIEPVGPEDEDAANQETDYLNWLFYKKNDGWLILYTWFKDALLSKNGITKHWVDECRETTTESYYGLSDIEYQSLLAEDDLELVEHEEKIEVVVTDMGEQEMRVHDARFTRKEEEKRVVIEVVPPEEFRISKDARSPNPKKARFCAHEKIMTISSLREMGFRDQDILMMDVDVSDLAVRSSEERQARYNHAEETRFLDPAILNDAMREVRMVEAYVYADMNDDGIAELLRVWRSGDFIDWEEAEFHPFNAITPIILTHKFWGLSVADIIRDLQEIRTELMRGYLDNIHQSINGRTYFNENTVNLEDLLTSKPWGLVAVDGSPGSEVMIDRSSGLDPSSYSLLDILDKMRQERVGEVQAQLDPNVLAQANTGVIIKMLNEAKAKVEMIARIFAETGVKSLFRDLHEVSRKYADREHIVKLRNSWVPVNPSEWRERTDFTVTVGLGTDSKQEKAANLGSIIDMQKSLVQLGVPAVLPQNIYAAAKDYVEAVGLRPDEYFVDPAMIPPQPQQPDPNMILVQLQSEIEQAKAQTRMAEIQQKEIQGQREAELKQQELELQARNIIAKQQIDALKTEIESLKAASSVHSERSDTELKRATLTFENQLKALELALKEKESEERMMLEQYKAELQAVTSAVSRAPQVATDSQVSQILAGLVDSMQSIQADLKRLHDEQSSPKEIVRDDNGRIVQIGLRKILRDENGRAVGIG